MAKSYNLSNHFIKHLHLATGQSIFTVYPSILKSFSGARLGGAHNIGPAPSTTPDNNININNPGLQFAFTASRAEWIDTRTPFSGTLRYHHQYQRQGASARGLHGEAGVAAFLPALRKVSLPRSHAVLSPLFPDRRHERFRRFAFLYTPSFRPLIPPVAQEIVSIESVRRKRREFEEILRRI